MSWGIAFRLRQYLKQSLWFLPLVGAVLGPLLGALDHRVEGAVTIPVTWQYSASTASTLLTTIVGAMIALTGFLVTVTILVIQMATGTFSARYMRLWYRDRLLKAVLAVLIGTLTFSFTLLRRVESDAVPSIGVTTSGVLVVLGLVLFLFFLDRFVHRLRPVAVAALMVQAAQGVIATTAAPPAHGDAPQRPPAADGPAAFVVRSRRSGAIQALDERGLAAWARRHDCRLVVSSAVGDFVATGAPLVEVHGAVPDLASSQRRLGGMIAFGSERTIEQDPAFAVRIMVDVAIRALSAAINDPTTAVQVLDHLEDLLRQIGATELPGRTEVRDDGGTVRLELPVRG